MIRFRSLPLLLVLLAAFLGMTGVAALAGRAQLPIRVHYSGNLEGELEPCG